MKDKDKLILILYYDFNLATDIYLVSKRTIDAEYHFSSKFDDSVKVLVIATFKGGTNTHFEYINKEKATDGELERLEELLYEYKQMLNNNEEH